MKYEASGSKNISGMIGNYTASANFWEPDAYSVQVSEFKTSWTVPSLPKSPNNTSTLYLWNGLQPNSGSAILQPVLAWHPGATSWCVSCWYSKDGHQYFEGNRVLVDPGDSIEGRIVYLRNNGSAFTYRMEFTGERFTSTTMTVDMPFAMNMLMVCFEPYANDYRQLPPDPLVKMHNISVSLLRYSKNYPVVTNIDWYFWNNGIVTPSGINGKIVSNLNLSGEIDFYFQ